MNLFEQLKNIELLDLEETAEVKIEKLSKLTKQEFVITVKAISPTVIAKIRSKQVMGVKTSQGKEPVFDLGDIAGKEIESSIAIITAGWEEANSKDLQKKLDVQNAKDLINKIMYPSDISNVANKILQISDINNEVEEEKKE